jgi:lipid-A-disaccharide synthase-like uncharacterized protein
MVWFYITLTLVTATGVFLVGWLLRKHPAKRLIGAWVCLATGACFFVIYALDGEHSVFTLAAGLTMFAIGAVALIGVTGKRSS